MLESPKIGFNCAISWPRTCWSTECLFLRYRVEKIKYKKIQRKLGRSQNNKVRKEKGEKGNKMGRGKGTEKAGNERWLLSNYTLCELQTKKNVT